MAKARKGGGKRKSLKSHARVRAFQRVGVDLPPGRQNEIVRMIQAGETTPVGRSSGRVSHHLVEIAGVPCRVLYDRIRKCLVTVWPEPDPRAGPEEGS